MVHHLWYDSFDAEADDVRRRPRSKELTRQPAPRRGGARRAVGKALIELGERIVSDPGSSNKAVGE